MDEGEDDVAFRSDDRSVRLFGYQKAINRSGGGLNRGRGSRSVVMAESVRKRVE